jgi:DNA-binding transcriptional LysR family regulator
MQSRPVAAIDPRDLGDLVALARAGSLHAAARARGVAGSTLSRRIAALERALALALVDRRYDGSRLTEAGQALAQIAAPLDDQMARIVRAVDALREGRASAPLRISATEFVVSDVLAPALPLLWQQAAHVHVDLRAQADIVSLAARDADIAIRMVRPEGASLVARRLAVVRLGLFAAPAWLAGRAPAAIDLATAPLLHYDDSYGRTPERGWVAKAGLESAIVMRTGSTRALLTACRAGAGIALLPVAFADRAALVEIPSPLAIPPREPWLVTHPDVRRDPRVRLVQRWITAAFAALDTRA